MIFNFTEIIVEEIYNEIIHSFPHACTCEECKNDVFCIALNRLQPMYATSSTGRAYSKLMEYEPQFKVEVFKALTSAIETVAASPRCQQPE